MNGFKLLTIRGSALACLCVLVALVAWPERPVHAADLQTAVHTQAETGIEVFDHDLYATVGLGGGLQGNYGDLKLYAPLRLRLSDGAPLAVEGAPALRRQDWDELGDFLHILRHATLRDPGERGSLQIGQLQGVTLGHGTLIDRYYNDLDFDHHQTGVHASGDGGWVGGQAIVSDVISHKPAGFRVFGRPFWGHGSRLGSLTVGVNAALDQVAAYAPLRLFGLDIGSDIWQGNGQAIDLYVDGNTRIHGGQGLHAGADYRWTGAHAYVQLRLELQWLHGAYDPAALDTLYAIERSQIGPAIAWLDPQGHVQSLVIDRTLATSALTGERLGALGSLQGAVGGVRYVAKVDFRGQDGWGAYGWLVLPPWQGLEGRLFFGQRHLQAWHDLGQGAMAQAQLRFRVQGPWYASLFSGRQWHQDPAGLYRADWDVVAMVGLDGVPGR